MKAIIIVESNVAGILVQIATAIIAVKSAKGFMREIKIAHPIQIHLILYLIRLLQSIYPLNIRRPP